MSDNKKYYYFRMTENFFDSESMIVLESMQDGYLYSNILLKLYAKSLKGDGRLMFNDRIPYNSTVLAQITRHQVGTVEKALQIFRNLGLIEVLDNGAIYMLDIQSLIGKSTTEADRKRNYRQRIESEKNAIPMLESNSGDKCPDKRTDKYPPEIEIEYIDRVIDTEINLIGGKPPEADISNFFESVWVLLPSNPNDRKKAVKPKRKKELYAIGYEKIKQACENYLEKQDPNYRHRRDNFFNDVIENYIYDSITAFENPSTKTTEGRNLQ